MRSSPSVGFLGCFDCCVNSHRSAFESRDHRKLAKTSSYRALTASVALQLLQGGIHRWFGEMAGPA